MAGCYPIAWSKGLIKLLYKGKSVNELNNFRDITILSCLGKVFDQILNLRLAKWVESLNILYNTQAGFRKNFSTEDNIFVLNTLITKSRYDGQKLYCAFIDYKKAFNSVYREGLWYKLMRYGCRGRLLKLLISMYSNTVSCIQTKEGITEFFKSFIGVQQGAVLSPLLFSLYVNDLNEALLDRDGVFMDDISIKVLLYADDLVLVLNTIDGFKTILTDYMITAPNGN